MFKCANHSSQIATKVISFSVVFMLMFTTVLIFNTSEVNAATKIKVTKVAFSPKSLNVSNATKEKKIKMTLTLSKNVKGTNYAKVTLKNGKKTRTISAKAKMKGKKLTLNIYAIPQDMAQYPLNLRPGKWKVTKVVLQKNKTGKEWRSGFLSGGKWFPGQYVTKVVSTKTLASGKSSKATKLNIVDGKKTVLSLTGPEDFNVLTQDGITYKAKLTSGGKPLAGKKVSLLFDSVEKFSGTTDASGSVTFTLTKQEFTNKGLIKESFTYYWVKASFKGNKTLKSSNSATMKTRFNIE